jgi:hypothetical protein
MGYMVVKLSTLSQVPGLEVQAPHRYDLKEWSCVNVERKTYNMKLNKLMKNQKHVTIMNVDFERECFTATDSI